MPKYVLHTLLCVICLIIMRFIDGNLTTTDTLLINSNATAHNLSYKNDIWRHSRKKIEINNLTTEAMPLESAGSKLNGNLRPNANQNMTKESDKPLFQKIHFTLTRSKDAVWATMALTFMCVVLLIAVAQSQMWRDHHVAEAQGIPLPNFNERVPFKEVMERKMTLLKEMFKKRKHRTVATELESLLVEGDSE